MHHLEKARHVLTIVYHNHSVDVNTVTVCVCVCENHHQANWVSLMSETQPGSSMSQLIK